MYIHYKTIQKFSFGPEGEKDQSERQDLEQEVYPRQRVISQGEQSEAEGPLPISRFRLQSRLSLLFWGMRSELVDATQSRNLQAMQQRLWSQRLRFKTIVLYLLYDLEHVTSPLQASVSLSANYNIYLSAMVERIRHYMHKGPRPVSGT